MHVFTSSHYASLCRGVVLWMDRYILVESCLDFMLNINTIEIMKLASFGVCANCSPSKNDNLVDVAVIIVFVSGMFDFIIHVCINVGFYRLVLSPETAISNIL